MRNEDRHGKDQTTKAQAEQRQAIREIELLYAKAPRMPNHLQFIFAKPLEQRIQDPTSNMLARIVNYGPLIKETLSGTAPERVHHVSEEVPIDA